MLSQKICIRYAFVCISFFGQPIYERNQLVWRFTRQIHIPKINVLTFRSIVQVLRTHVTHNMKLHNFSPRQSG